MDNQMGNTMERPTLLMKPYQLRETTQNKESLQMGSKGF